MKKTKLFGWVFIASMMSLSACSNDAEEVLTQENEIKLTSEITPSRVTSLNYQSTQIVEGQQIGVTITGAKSEHKNKAWAVGADGALTNTDDAVYYSGNNTATITAYHPYNSAWTGTSHAFSVSTDQSNEANYRNSDLLWATASSSKTDKAVGLIFAHKLAKVNVTLTSTDIADLSGATISICGTKISTSFNPITGELSSANNVANIEAGVTTSTAYTASAIIIPQELESGTKFIKVTHNNKNFYYTLSADKEFKSGYSYSYTLKVKEKLVEVEVESDNITDWTDEDINGDAEEDVSKLTVTLTEAGTLGNYLTDANKDVVEELKIIGNINGTDIQVIRDITNLDNFGKPTENTGALVILDLSEANIVAGGNPYTSYNKAKEINTQDNVVTAYMFEQTQLKTIILPNNITEIGDHAFEVVFNLESFVIPNGVTKLGICAFNTSTKLKSITIPESVVEIGRDAFNECAFTEITLPSKLKVIDEWTFYICRNLKTITLPAELTDIKMDAFYGCENLIEVHCKNSTAPSIYKLAFRGISLSSCTLYVPIGSKSNYQTTDYWKEFGTIIEE